MTFQKDKFDYWCLQMEGKGLFRLRSCQSTSLLDISQLKTYGVIYFGMITLTRAKQAQACNTAPCLHISDTVSYTHLTLPTILRV